jgi:plasmid maintenance system antidote protein VapI
MMNIHDRIEHIILQEKLSIAAFERQIGVGRNSLSTSLRKQSVISHEVIIKIFEHFPRYSLDWMFFGNKKPEDIEIEKLSAEIISSIKRWRDLSDKNI